MVLRQVAVVLVCIALQATAEILEYHDQLAAGTALAARVAMFAPNDTPAGYGNDSFMKLAVTLALSNPTASGPVEILFYSAKEQEYIGKVDGNGQRRYCCGPDDTECETGSAIIPESPVHDRLLENRWAGVLSNASVPVAFTRGIPTSDVYYLVFLNCLSSTGDVALEGTVTWKNPYGYLSGDVYPTLPFNGILCLFYIFLGLVWLVLSAMQWRVLLLLQVAISFVIALGMTETATWYFDLVNLNHTGKRETAPIVFGVLVSTFKRTIARVLILAVSMGYGVVKPTLGKTTKPLAALAVAYFVFSATTDLFERLEPGGNLPVSVVVFVVLPVAVLDTSVYWWTFVSLTRTVKHLTQRQQSVKLRMYHKFAAVLGVSVLASCLMIISQMIMLLVADKDKYWRTWWMFHSFWHVMFVGILVGIMIIWRPRKNNTRLSFEQLADEDAEDVPEDIAMAQIRDSAPRQRTADVGGNAMEDARPASKQPKTKSTVEQQAMKAMAAAAFTIAEAEGTEEDKMD